ncbi:hypothetical protein EVAR_55842_1 [Eumeta japonica]|uniref:Uncharacterized protein n=1 Tax=Eumeta variegata TaxID=151549 RepID=A0A4C1ZC14_EUMVA|nr:hypothetical protein EVAR_55842_1 [Eumeta japonica]
MEILGRTYIYTGQTHNPPFGLRRSRIRALTIVLKSRRAKPRAQLVCGISVKTPEGSRAVFLGATRGREMFFRQYYKGKLIRYFYPTIPAELTTFFGGAVQRVSKIYAAFSKKTNNRRIFKIKATNSNNHFVIPISQQCFGITINKAQRTASQNNNTHGPVHEMSGNYVTRCRANGRITRKRINVMRARGRLSQVRRFVRWPSSRSALLTAPADPARP